MKNELNNKGAKALSSSQGQSRLVKVSQAWSRLKTTIIFSLIMAALFQAGAPVASTVQAASVLIPLQTCGIAPAANRDVVLTPIQAQGANEIPVMDRIQTNTDQNGNALLSLLPGVYQCDIRPAWGQVGVTEFYFYVDPSNATQNAFANLLTSTNNTYPPNQFAYSAQASDARYAPIGVVANTANAVTNTQNGVTLGFPFLWGPGLVWDWTTNSNSSLELQDEGQGGTPQWLFWGNGNFTVLGNNGGSGGYGNVTGAVLSAQSAITIQGNPVETNGTPVPFATNAMTASNALNLGGFIQNYYTPQLPIDTPMPVLWLSAESFENSSELSLVSFWPDLSGNGNNFYATGANDYFTNSIFPAVWSSGTLNGSSPWGFVCTNFFKNYPSLNTNITILMVYLNDPSDYNSSANNFGARMFGAGSNSPAVDDGFVGYSYSLNNSTPGGGTSIFANGNPSWWITDQQTKYHVVLYNFSGAYARTWEDGIITMDGSIPWSSFGSAPYIAATNNLYLFNKASTGAYPWIGWMAEFLVWTNVFTPQQCQAIDRAYAKKYDEQNRLLVLDGDSIMIEVRAWDNGSLSGSTLPRLVASYLPFWDVVCTAVGGRDSLEVLTNEISWIHNRRGSAGPNIIVTDGGIINDVLYVNAPNGTSMTVAQAATQLPLSETNAIQFCVTAHAYNWKIYWNPLVSGFWETNGFKTNFNNWLYANSNFCDGIVGAGSPFPTGTDPILTNGAYANSVIYYSDQLHPNWFGALLQSTNIFTAVSTNY